MSDELTKATTAPTPARVQELAGSIDLADPGTILRFGAEAQNRAAAAADAMLGAARNPATGEAGEALSGLLDTLRGFDVTKLSEKPGLVGRLLGRGQKQVTTIMHRYETVRGQIEAIGDKLDGHRTHLLEDVERLERLYLATLDWFHALAEHIAAGETVLARTDNEVIPAALREAESAPGTLAAQRLADLRGARDELDRRVHDLRLTRQVAMQSLPALRLIQENDKALAAKIHSVLANTVPLWRTQLAQALAIQRMRDAGAAVRSATDLTNKLLTANAETLRAANAEARTELERGVFDLDAVKQANAALVATLEDTLRIAAEGRATRQNATKELALAEQQIRKALTDTRDARLHGG
ncbi:toxic anion resistance protein [Pseudoroseomonas wenyumeiae]|uniref:Toxic anion resistance protein n=1 Tax=Teichococcus wenyumeiae TaxID=2478470 RepID=A0A3A9JKE8_9PROT|nr:toxic anion resistance protein [Pseudoroseomonas wenyumeiae]RKK05701.1 toxic anion resistance protein [Pseudoroseomonas wenyumeiae]RMI25988.1 toxic anion resistance protein [Pseudoroseomonas wenyumeiae]